MQAVLLISHRCKCEAEPTETAQAASLRPRWNMNGLYSQLVHSCGSFPALLLGMCSILCSLAPCKQCIQWPGFPSRQDGKGMWMRSCMSQLLAWVSPVVGAFTRDFAGVTPGHLPEDMFSAPTWGLSRRLLTSASLMPVKALHSLAQRSPAPRGPFWMNIFIIKGEHKCLEKPWNNKDHIENIPAKQVGIFILSQPHDSRCTAEQTLQPFGDHHSNRNNGHPWWSENKKVELKNEEEQSPT